MNREGENAEKRRWNGARASIYTLGCRLNQADSALMADDLVRHGFVLVPWGEEADLLIINSCTVTSPAARKTRQSVGAARKRCPHAFVVVAGCDVNVSGERWQQSDLADLLVGNVVKERLSQLLPCPLPAHEAQQGNPPPKGMTMQRQEAFVEPGVGLFAEKTRPYVKIQEGCDFRCAYCIVPDARGAAHSRDWDDILREAAVLLERGAKELVLTGVNIATYRHQGRTLADLLPRILELNPDFRLRLSSTEPTGVIADIIEIMAAEPRICRFLHLPLQYGHDRILALMKRRYTIAEYRAMAEHAAGKIPGLCLGSDIIVGFPGERDADFAACCDTIRTLPINHLHVFSYSRRQGTPAAALPNQVPGDLASRRNHILSRIGEEKAARFAASHVGLSLNVLLETRTAEGTWEGWSDNYLRVEIADSPDMDLAENQLVRVAIREALNGRCLRGVVSA